MARLDRNQLAKIVGNDPIAIREFERLLDTVQANIAGMTVITLNYSSTGILSTPLPALFTYSLSAGDGSTFRSGVSWGVTVLSGTFSGAAPTIGGTGNGILQLNSGIATPTAAIAVTARVNGRGYPPFTVMIQRSVAPVDGGTGGTAASDTTATLATFNNAAFSVLTRSLVITTPASATQANLVASLVGLDLDSALPTGDTTVQFKWQRETAPSVWTDVGAVATSSPNPSVVDIGDPSFPAYSGFLGSITCNRTETGLSGSTQYTYRLVARVSAGNIRTVYPSGTASVTS